MTLSLKIVEWVEVEIIYYKLVGDGSKNSSKRWLIFKVGGNKLLISAPIK
jgi:hypothetical protein